MHACDVCVRRCGVWGRWQSGTMTACVVSLEAGRLVAVQLLSCVRLCNCMDCSPPGSSVRGIFQARILEWVATSSSRGSS